MMGIIAFALLAFIVTVYVLLDGYDLGIATINPLVARGPQERAASMHAIGPFWNGNEVWLIVAGGALFALFPKAYASAFSGFYLPFIVVLWLLMFRGIAMELRDHFASPLWHTFWDFCFTAASVLLIFLFGITLGNLVRGVPLDEAGYFTGTFTFLLNPFAALAGILAVVALGVHGALFLMLRIEGVVVTRARALVARCVPIVAALYIALTVAAFISTGLPLWWLIIAVVGLPLLAIEFIANARGAALAAFGASCGFLVALLAGAAVAMFPYLLPGYPLRTAGISIENSSPSPAALSTALAVSIVGLICVIAYAAYVSRALSARK